MHATRSPSRRRGAYLVLLALAVCVVCFLLGLVMTRRSQQASRWTRHLRTDGWVADLLHSAMEEATHELMAGARDPSSPLHLALCRAPAEGLELRPTLSRTRALAATRTPTYELDAHLLLTDLAPVDAGFEAASERRGLARVQVAVLDPATRRPLLEGGQVRELVIASVSPPRPLDRMPFLDAAKDGAGFELDPEAYRRRAALRVEVDGRGDPNPAFGELVERLGGLSGVVFVDNAGGRPLRLRSHRHRGRALLVVRGPLELSHLSLAGPEDRLTVVAFGDVVLDGEVEARLVLTRAPGSDPVERLFRTGTRVRGSLVLTEGSFSARTGLELDVRLGPSSPDGEPILAGNLHVAVSPGLLEDRVVVP